MNILTFSGSAQKDSTNQRFLKSLPQLINGHHFTHFDALIDFPLFSPQRNEHPPEAVLDFKEKLKEADLVVISFPEYVHNIPAVLKNAFEWITSSGELYEKKVMVISYTPNPPRGEKAMQSVLWSLQALNAKVVAELPLYMSEIKVTEEGELEGKESVEQIKSVFEFI